MIKVFIPTDPLFKKFKQECKNLYEQVQDKITDTNSFDFIISNTFFYLFTNQEEKLIGAIYFFLDKNNRLFLNGFAKPKFHLLNLQCLKLSLTWFSIDIYAEAQNRASALCLIRVGFKRIKDNLFVYKYIISN